MTHDNITPKEDTFAEDLRKYGRESLVFSREAPPEAKEQIPAVDKDRAAFEEWNATIFTTSESAPSFMYNMRLITWQAATAARDAHWREKLESEEMVEVVAGVLLDINYGGTQRGGHSQRLAKAALAAISKEMGV